MKIKRDPTPALGGANARPATHWKHLMQAGAPNVGKDETINTRSRETAANRPIRKSRTLVSNFIIENHKVERGRYYYFVKQPTGNFEWKDAKAFEPEMVSAYWTKIGRSSPAPSRPQKSARDKKSRRRKTSSRIRYADTPACMIGGKAFFYVEKLLDRKEEAGQVFHKVKWIGYDDPEDNSWEPEGNLDCEVLIKAFNAARALGSGSG